jgi:hypothetical protein
MSSKASTPEERVEQLLEYCNDKEWNSAMEKFMVDECIVFEEYDEGGEYSLQQTDTYHKFLKLFEGKLEDYMKKSGYSKREIFSDFRLVEEQNPDSFTAHAIQFVLAVVEFKVFASLMYDTYKTTTNKKK